MRNPANKQANKHTKVIAIYRFSRDKKEIKQNRRIEKKENVVEDIDIGRFFELANN